MVMLFVFWLHSRKFSNVPDTDKYPTFHKQQTNTCCQLHESKKVSGLLLLIVKVSNWQSISSICFGVILAASAIGIRPK